MLSAAEVRNVMRSSSISGEMYNMEKSNGSPPDTAGISTNKKRRSSLGAKMVAIVGLSQWSKSTLQLNQAGKDRCVQSCSWESHGLPAEEGVK